MAMKKKRCEVTSDLFDWTPAKITKEYEKQAVKAQSANAKYAKAVALTLLECHLSREEIASQMSDYLNENISENMLNAYASETRAAHMISVSRLEALIFVTKDSRLLSLIAEIFQLIVVDSMFSHLIKAVQFGDKAAEFEAEQKQHRSKFKYIASMRGFDL